MQTVQTVNVNNTFPPWPSPPCLILMLIVLFLLFIEVEPLEFNERIRDSEILIIKSEPIIILKVALQITELGILNTICHR